MQLGIVSFSGFILLTICTLAESYYWDWDDSDTSPSKKSYENSDHSEHHHSKGGKEGGGHEKHSSHYDKEKGKTKSGNVKVHDEEEAKKGSDLEWIHAHDEAEEGGKKHKHHGKKYHESYEDENGEDGFGGKYEDSQKHKKLNYRKGYREKYHKDEAEKHDRFFSNADKSGEYEIYGKGHAKHSSNKHYRAKENNHKEKTDKKKYGKKSKGEKGHHDSDRKVHQSSGGKETHHNHHDSWGKKHKHKGGNKYQYNS
ncbi:unnamed protein product [Acanthoscelides obtectus]|uniref:Uncharacterized protein n=1 Tax=Acanthoscelides obtectus TaxID=200917 RepID=A0A9P0PPP0_ACAOB|nr:unnamed protein product [Acanthoscelides obtectus]CAK1664945.1 hypothetical protein AOBTE_LOCUS24569 [Acanthoscelides obtectus]